MYVAPTLLSYINGVRNFRYSYVINFKRSLNLNQIIFSGVAKLLRDEPWNDENDWVLFYSDYALSSLLFILTLHYSVYSMLAEVMLSSYICFVTYRVGCNCDEFLKRNQNLGYNEVNSKIFEFVMMVLE